MAGQTNSWMGQINISPVPCIGDTVRKVGSTNQYGDGTTDGAPADGSESPFSTASIWWWIAAGLFVGYLFKGKKHESRYY